jgi:hypothetical protein
MDNKKDSTDSTDQSPTDILVDFGNDFGTVSKQEISDIFVDIHASISPLDPLNKL